jgi:hypothetical protein
MEFQPVDLKELIGIVGGMLVVLIPVMGATIRFSAKPLIELLTQTGVIGSTAGRSAQEAPSKKEHELLARRVLELEQELSKVKALRAPEPLAQLEADASPAGRSGELHRIR